MTYAPIFTTEDYLSALQKLLPRGPVWQHDLDSIQAKTERGLVAAWWRVNVADHNLLVDAFPASAVGLLPEWEQTLGLPDPCAGPAPTIAARQQQVVAMLTDNGGQNASDYIARAEALGYEITITQHAPFRAGQNRAGDPLGGPGSGFVWTVNAPLQTSQYFRAGLAHAGEPLQTWGNEVLECAIEAAAPAHTVVNFTYGADIPEGFGLDFSTGKFYSRVVGGSPVAFANFTDMFTFTRSTTGTYRDTTGLLRTAAINAPRIECAPDGSLQGLLLERPATNIALRSEDIAAALWGKNATSGVADAGVAPDGATTADKLVEDNTNAFHYAAQNVTVVSGTTYCFSVFCKAVPGSATRKAQVQLGGVGFPQQFTLADLSTGAVVLGNGALAGGAEKYGNGWWRVWVVGAATGTGGAPLLGLNNVAASTYLGDGTSGIYFWGAQLEAASRMSSYIPTALAAASRGADVCSRALGGEFNSLAGTAVCEGVTSPGQDAVLAQAYWNFDDATGNNRIGLLRQATTDLLALRIFSGGASQCAADGSSGSLTPFKSAAAWAANDFAHSVNGAAVATDLAGALPTTLTEFDLGNLWSTATNYGNCHIKKFTYYPTRKSNAELQALAA